MIDEETKPRHPLWRTVRIAVGIALVPIGVIGLFVPVLQGVLLLLLAFALLASEIPIVAKWRDRLRQRFPRFFSGRG
jgi:uncharacterized membrane protein YbaN (DUF454 family)